MKVRNVSLALVLLLGTAVGPAIAQVPVQEKIHFTVSTPFQIKGNNTILPAGDYLLFQVKPNDRYLFALYRGDMTHSPIAMIHAVRIYYSLGRLPGKTRMLLETDETSAQNYMVLEGWNVPGDYGWRVIGVTPRAELLNTMIKVRK